MKGYTIRLPVFEGPPDLLLYLVERRELEPAEVSVADVTAQYRVQLASGEQINLDAASEVLVTLARLLAFKARSLLPADAPAAGEPGPEAGEVEQPASLRALAEDCRFVRIRAQALAGLAEGQALRFRRPPYAALSGAVQLPEWSPVSEDLSPVELSEAFRRAWTKHRRRARFIPGQPLGIRRRMAEVLRVLRAGGEALFSALCRRARSRAEIVVTFLALLELVRRRRITLTQPEPFADLAIGIRGAAGRSGE